MVERIYCSVSFWTIPVSAGFATHSSRISSRSKTGCIPTTAPPSSHRKRSAPSSPARRKSKNKNREPRTILRFSFALIRFPHAPDTKGSFLCRQGEEAFFYQRLQQECSHIHAVMDLCDGGALFPHRGRGVLR